MRSCPPIFHLDQQIVEIGLLYRSTNEATTWITVNGITHRGNAIGNACRDLYTFEFEFEFCRHGNDSGGKTN